MFICLIPKIGTKYSLAKGLGTQYRDVSENEVFHFMVLSVRGSRAVKPRRGCCSPSSSFQSEFLNFRLQREKYREKKTELERENVKERKNRNAEMQKYRQMKT